MAEVSAGRTTRDEVEFLVERLYIASLNKRDAAEYKRSGMLPGEPYPGYDDEMIDMMDRSFAETRESVVSALVALIEESHECSKS